jgi:hydrogenase maturation factor
MKLPDGKIPTDILREVVFKHLGAKRNEVVLGPSTGIDGAVVDIGNRSLISSMDPITGALDRIGWLAVNINANDVATFGVEPAFFLSCIMLPKNSDREMVEAISVQMGEAAKKLGVAIVGGHCEITQGLRNPIIVGCMMGETEKGNYVTAAGAKPEDVLILTKSTGIEGTAILASDREDKLRKSMDQKMLRSAKRFYDQVSVVEEAITAFKTGGVDAMHDPTEGGVVGGIYEMADASKLGVRIVEGKITIRPETLEICKFFKINPLQLISSGALLIAVRPNAAGKVIENLHKKRIESSIIGNFVEDVKDRVLVRNDGAIQALPKPASDQLWLALQRK